METILNPEIHSLSVTVFRAYDVRGVYDTDLNEQLAKRVDAAFRSYAEGGSVSLEKTFLSGVLSTGCEVHSYGYSDDPLSMSQVLSKIIPKSQKLLHLANAIRDCSFIQRKKPGKESSTFEN